MGEFVCPPRDRDKGGTMSGVRRAASVHVCPSSPPARANLALTAVALIAAIGCRAEDEAQIELRTQAATVPSGFVDTVVAQGLTSPSAIAVLPDGRVLVAQQNGQLKVIKNDALLPTNFITVDTDYSNARGLLGVSVDASFATNQYV